MNFEYDPKKSDSNLEKHKIDFKDAQLLWKDERLLEVELSFPNETRFLCIGKIKDKHYTAVVTHRNSAIRLISVRRSRKEEVYQYENNS